MRTVRLIFAGKFESRTNGRDPPFIWIESRTWPFELLKAKFTERFIVTLPPGLGNTIYKTVK